MVWLTVILFLVMLISSIVFLKPLRAFLELDSTTLEVTWTLIPILILVSIASPSIILLSKQDSFNYGPALTLKVLRSQWSWQREASLEGTDHLLDSEKLDELSNFTSPVIVPVKKLVRVVLTRTDVLHSLGLPRVGVKLDSNPGRLNSSAFSFQRFGLTTGSCYELCGRGHRAMPIFFRAA